MKKWEFQKQLKQLIDKSGKRYWEIAKDVRVKDCTVRNWLAGRDTPNSHNLNKLAKYFGVHPAYLEYGIDNEIIQMIIEIKEHEPETFEKLKKIVSTVYDINRGKREKTIIEKERKLIEQKTSLQEELLIYLKDL